MDKIIPDGWQIVNFGDVVNKINDRVPNRDEWTFDRYIAGEHIESEQIRVTKFSPILGNEEKIGSAFHMKFQPGHVLYVSRRAYLRKGGMVDFEGICSNTTFILQADESRLLQSLVPFIIQTEDFVKHTTDNSHGSTNPFLNWKDIAKYKLLLPSFKEQQQISDALWSIEHNIDKIEHVVGATEKMATEMLHKLLTKGIAHNKFKDDESGGSLHAWNSFKLSQVVDIIGGGTPKTTKPSYWNGNIPWISVEDFDSEIRYLESTKKTITQEGLENSSTRMLPKDSIVISARGTVGLFGQLAKPMAFNQSCYGLIGKDNISNDFVYYLLLFKLDELKHKSYGSTFKSITRKDFDLICVDIPNITEQNQIVKVLDEFMVTTSNYRDHIQKLINLKKKLTNDYLSGKLLIPKEVL